MKTRHLLPLLLVASAHAGPFVEVGLGASFGADQYNCISDYDEKTHRPGCSDNPLGSIAAGWEHKGFAVQVEHVSSLREKDRGLNTVWIKYRHDFMK